MEKVRFNIQLSEELKDWYKTQAEGFGCSINSMMVIALAQYKTQCEGMGMMKEMGKLYELIDQIQKKEAEKS
jgi:hypothetical protein